jgi:PhnB protein
MADPIPEGYPALTPSLTIDGAAEAIEFYERAFGAKVRGRMDAPDGKVAHAELEIGDGLLMVGDPFPQSTLKSPKELGGTATGLFMYVEDVDAAVQRAVDAGATVTSPVEDQFWGDRFGKIADPFGHEWQLATHTEDLTEEEIEKRGREMMGSLS